MQTRTWVYRRNLSNNPQSPFRSNEGIMYKAGCCISGFLGFVFLGLALFCLFCPQIDKDRKLFLIFIGIFGIFEIICFIYGCVSFCQKYNSSSHNEVRNLNSRRPLLSNGANGYQEIPDYHGMANYQACGGIPEVPSYQADASYEEIPKYLPASYGESGGYLPGLANLHSLVNYEGVFAHQQIPIYQQDLLEPQLPPYTSAYIQSNTSPQKNILVR